MTIRAKIRGNSTVTGNSRVTGDVIVQDDAIVMGGSSLDGKCVVRDNAYISDLTYLIDMGSIGQDAYITNSSDVLFISVTLSMSDKRYSTFYRNVKGGVTLFHTSHSDTVPYIDTIDQFEQDVKRTYKGFRNRNRKKCLAMLDFARIYFEC